MKILKAPIILFLLSYILHADTNKDLHIAFASYNYNDDDKRVIKSVAIQTINEIEKDFNINIYPYFPHNEKKN